MCHVERITSLDPLSEDHMFSDWETSLESSKTTTTKWPQKLARTSSRACLWHEFVEIGLKAIEDVLYVQRSKEIGFKISPSFWKPPILTPKPIFTAKIKHAWKWWFALLVLHFGHGVSTTTRQFSFGKQTQTLSFKPDYSFGIAKRLSMLKKYYEIGLYDA